MKKLIALLAAAFTAAFTFADGESLAETGGYVPTDAPALAFKDITLADLGTTYIPVARMSGGAIDDDGAEAMFFHPAEVEGGRTYQIQVVDGTSTKCSIVAFSNGVGGVYARAINTKYSEASNYGTDLSTANDGWYEGVPATSATGTGYAVYDLGLIPVACSSINVNIAYDNNNLANNSTAFAGAREYVRPLSDWINVASVAGDTDIGSDRIVKISGVPNTGWRCSGLSTSYSLQHGYLDENGNDGVLYAPTVTITGVPYGYYRVIAYASTDTGNAQFGYVTINGTDYTSTYQSTSTAFGSDFKTQTGTDNWGHAGSEQYAKSLAEGINYLVSPILSGDTVTVSGHRVSGSVRGCIAAVQVVSIPVLSASNVSVAWSQGNWGGNAAPIDHDAVISIDGDVTLTIDKNIDMDSVRIVGTGSLTLVATDWESINFGNLSVDDGVTLAIDATAGLVAGSRLKAMLHNGISGTVIVKGLDDNGLSMTLSNYAETYNFTTHVKFVGGVHNIYDTYGEGSTALCENSSNSDPWLTVADGTVLNITAHDFGGYTGTDRAASCVISVSDGGVLNIKGDGSHTFYYQGRFLVAPGGALNIAAQSSNTGFRINGGTREGYEQFYVADQMESSEKHATLADTSENKTGNVCSASDASTGIGVYVGANAQLDWSAPIRNGNGGSDIVKRGAGVWNLTGSISNFTGNIAVTAGTLVFGADNTLNTTVSGTVVVPNGVTLTINAGASAGDIDISGGGVIDIVANDVDDQTTVYIPVGDSLTIGAGEVKLNGTTIDADIWELAGGKFVNKNLKTAITTATGNFAFTTAQWTSALGDDSEIDWEGALSEVRVTANNVEHVVATVDLTVANAEKFVVDGDGDLSFEATDGGAVNAASYDFSASTGRIEYKFSTGSSPIISGANTVLSGGGSGTPTVAAGKTLTLGPWGDVDGDTATYSQMLMPQAGSTLIFAPGYGRTQKCTNGFGGTNTGTTIGVTNGTLVVHMKGGNDSVFFGVNSVRIDNGGILSLEAQDALGYYYARSLTINKGGVLSVKVRDTLKRTANMNGGTIEIQGENSGRALDFFNGNIINVTDDSVISGINDGKVDNPLIYFRDDSDDGSNVTVINIDDGKKLVNNVTYAHTGKVTIRGTMNNGNGNGSMVMNGFNGNPLVFTGLTTIGESGKPVMYVLNCEHQNGTYVVNERSRLMGSGLITGNGGVTLAASNAKICGSLTVNNLTAASGGTYGDQWNTVAAKVATSYFAAGTQTIQNGSFTIGADCVVTNATGATDTSDATFSIAANGNLVLGKSVSVGALTVADGGTVTLSASRSGAAKLTVAGTATCNGTVNFVVDFGSSKVPGAYRIALLKAVTLPENVTVTDRYNERKWRTEVFDGVLWACSNGGFRLHIR